MQCGLVGEGLFLLKLNPRLRVGLPGISIWWLHLLRLRLQGVWSWVWARKWMEMTQVVDAS